MAANALLIDTDILIDYLKGIPAAQVLIDSDEFDLYYSIWTRKELLAKTGLAESEREDIGELLRRFRLVPVDEQLLKSTGRF